MDSLPVEYLKGVMEKMMSYGDRVQLSLISGGPQPSYQVINNLGKTMAFDKNHHLLHPQEDEFTGPNATPIYSIEQIKSAITGLGFGAGSGSKTVRVARSTGGSTRVSAAKLLDQFAAQRYEYFKNHRQTLPPTITEHTEEITELMKKGSPVEEAFDIVVKKYY